MTIKIDQGFVSTFIAGSFGLPIAHENAAYSPTAGTAYAELKLFPNDILPADLTNTNDTTGIFQFVLRYPEGTGAIPAKTKADEIFAAFPIGSVIIYSGQRLTVTGQSRPDAIPEDGWFKIVGRITYQADIAR